MNGFRAYFYFQDVLADYSGDSSARIYMVFDDGSATGVKEIGNGRAVDSKYYDLQGRRVVKPGKGLYIRNGKKEVVK